MKKKLLQRCLLGAPLGVAMWFLIILAGAFLRNGEIVLVSGHGVFTYGSERNAVAAAVAGAMLIGMIWAGASLIYQETEWSLLKQTLVNCLVCVAPSMAIAWLMQWMPRTLDGIGQYLRLFGLIYALIWCVQYFGTRHRLKQINARLAEWDGSM